MNDPKRQEIKDRIAASQAQEQARKDQAQRDRAWSDSQNGTRGRSVGDRVGENAVEAKDGVLGFVKEHPLLTISGGVALGVLVAGMFPQARRAARRGSNKAAILSARGTQIVADALHEAMDTAEEGTRAGAARLEDLRDTIGEATRDLGETLGETARSAAETAREQAALAEEQARIASRDASKSIARLLRRITR